MNTACDICLKSFKRRDNMMRHKKTVHAKDNESDDEYDMDDSSTDSADNDNASDLPNSNTEEESMEEDDDDPWDSVIEKAFDQCQSQFEGRVAQLMKKDIMAEDMARTRAYAEMAPVYRKAIANEFIKRMAWFSLIRKDPLYMAIKKTANNLRDLEDYDVKESWKYASSKRKYLFDNLLRTYNPPDIREPVDGKDADLDESDGQNDR